MAEYSRAAQSLAAAYNEHLWDNSSGTYYAGLKKGEKKVLAPWKHESYERYYASIDQSREFFPPTAQAALVALDQRLVPPQRVPSVQRYVFLHHHELISPMSYLFAFDALYRMDTDEADRETLTTMRKRWAVMVGRKMPGTLGEQFGDESYYCHDFGPIPAAYLASRVLGVRRQGLVENKRITIEPRLGDLTEAEGVVVTRHGPVPVVWKRTPDRGLDFTLSVPEGITAELSVPRCSATSVLTVDGQTVSQPKATGRFLSTELRAGKHTGSVKP